VASTSPVIVAALLAGCQQQDTSSSSGGPAKIQQAQLDELAEACGFVCKSIADGEANISGIRSIDAFFSATVNLQDATARLQADVQASLGEIAGVLGIEAGATIEDTAAAIAAEVNGGFGGNLDGGLTLSFQPAQCSVSAKASVEAAAKCDAEVDPGMATVECKGTCEAEASAMVDCGADVDLKCTGTAPSFACEGSCKGSCELNAGATCEGTCQGTCQVDGTVACDGTCVLDGTVACDGTCLGTEQGGMCDGECQLNAGAMCTGECKVRAGAKCEGSCSGSCELSAGGMCDGECKGECTYTPPSGGCTGGAKASCEGSAMASVQCSGECKGEVEPPMVKAECEASAKAEASFSAECTPPSISIDYNLSADFEANGSVDAKAEFSAKIEAFGKAYAKLLAKGAEIKGIITATAALPEAGVDAVTDAVGELSGSANIQVAFQATCALDALPTAGNLIVAAVADLQASADAIVTVSGSVGG
jgi:hypothetical protein